jgi:Zn-dependent protease with chaperone function
MVEEMALASGIPVPAVFVLDREDGINAFAAGYSIHDAAVVVTRGCLERLDRDELQGVIAHEFSHILNGDMRLNIRMMGVLHGLLLLTIVGRGILRGGAYGRGRGGAGPERGHRPGLLLVVVGYLGVFFGKLIKAAISRQREYLADAAAVQFTRNPTGLAGALKKISHAPSRQRDGGPPRRGAEPRLLRQRHARELALGPVPGHPPAHGGADPPDRPGWDGRYDVKVPESMKQRAAAERAAVAR